MPLPGLREEETVPERRGDLAGVTQLIGDLGSNFLFKALTIKSLLKDHIHQFMKAL